MLISKMQNKIRTEKLENLVILGDFNFVSSVLDRNSQTLNRTDQEKHGTPLKTNSLCKIASGLQIQIDVYIHIIPKATRK